MDCDICGSVHNSERGLHCPACVRAALFPHRIEHAKILIDKETLGSRVEKVVNGVSDKRMHNADQSDKTREGDGSSKVQQQRAKAEIEDSRDRIQRITENADTLRARIEQYKKEIGERKASTETRRSELNASKDVISKSYSMAIEPLQKNTKKTVNHHDIVYERIVNSRVFLCREAASLAGLRQLRKVDNDGNHTESYMLSGIPVVDLRDLNNASVTLVNASLTNISRLLVLSCNYLDIRLPAEIVLPHRDYPMPTIFGVSSSYSGKPGFFPGSTPLGSPSASRLLDPQENQSRPRPLYLDRKLSVLAKEDSNAYSRFVEGVSLLAWNIAWLCRTQGVAVASHDWEEICAIGRNLWLLLVAPLRQPRPSLRRSVSSKDATPAAKTEVSRSPRELPQRTNSHSHSQKPPSLPASLGVFSHGTTYAFVEGAASPTARGAETSMLTWKYARPFMVVDKLRSFLQMEVYGLEWELLDEHDYRQEEAENDEALITAAEGKARPINAPGMESAKLNQEGKLGDDNEEDIGYDTPSSARNGETRARGTSGWTKVKSRTTA